jgi:hypothetical protein
MPAQRADALRMVDQVLADLDGNMWQPATLRVVIHGVVCWRLARVGLVVADHDAPGRAALSIMGTGMRGSLSHRMPICHGRRTSLKIWREAVHRDKCRHDAASREALEPPPDRVVVGVEELACALGLLHLRSSPWLPGMNSPSLTARMEVGSPSPRLQSTNEPASNRPARPAHRASPTCRSCNVAGTDVAGDVSAERELVEAEVGQRRRDAAGWRDRRRPAAALGPAD